MGLAKPALRLIGREHRRKAFAGPVLTLGRQNVYATMKEAMALLRSEKIEPAPIPQGEQTQTTIQDWIGTAYEGAISDVVFFRLLGLADIQALDYSDFEGAEIVHDLNLPPASELLERYDLILDSGTLEHVFDIRQALMNIALMLRPGGRVIHLAPTNNYVNHGFYQFSPTIFFDYYGANGFTDLRAFIIEHDTYLPESLPWDVFEVKGDQQPPHMTSRQSLGVFFVAEKTNDSTADRVPIQSSYQRIYQENKAGSTQAHGSGRLKQLIPNRVKGFLKRNLPGVGTTKKPWGLKRLERLK
jgi:SAM-dependent methyltransferase